MTPPVEALNESELLRDLRAGEPAAYQVLVQAHASQLLAVASRFLGNVEDARDTLQESFLSAYCSIHQFHGQSRLGTWLHRIVVNASLMRIRKRRRRPKELSLDPDPEIGTDPGASALASGWSAPPDEWLQRQETREMIRRGIRELSEPYREILILRDIRGLSTDETARALQVSRGVVKTRLHRARHSLRAHLAPYLRVETSPSLGPSAAQS